MTSITSINFWESEESSPISDFLLGLIEKDKVQIKKKMDLFVQKSVQELCRLEDLKKIRGTANPALYELKFRLHNPYRAICLRTGENGLLILEMFKGSGSGGEVERHLPLARKRFEQMPKINI